MWLTELLYSFEYSIKSMLWRKRQKNKHILQFMSPDGEPTYTVLNLDLFSDTRI